MAPSACARTSAATNETLWPPTKIRQSRQHRLDPLGQVHDLGHVGQVIEAEADRLRAVLDYLTLELRPAVDLQVSQPDVMTLGEQGGRHSLQPERLEPQEDLRVHQRGGMDKQNAHKRASGTLVQELDKLRTSRGRRPTTPWWCAIQAPGHVMRPWPGTR